MSYRDHGIPNLRSGAAARGPGEGECLVAQPWPVHGRPRLGNAWPVARDPHPQRQRADRTAHWGWASALTRHRSRPGSAVGRASMTTSPAVGTVTLRGRAARSSSPAAWAAVSIFTPTTPTVTAQRSHAALPAAVLTGWRKRHPCLDWVMASSRSVLGSGPADASSANAGAGCSRMAALGARRHPAASPYRRDSLDSRMSWRHMSIARRCAVHREGPRSAGKDQPAPVQVPASACCLHEGQERSVGVGWGGAGSQTRVGDGAGQPRSGRDVTARQALCGLTKPGQEVCAIPAWRDQRVRRVEVEPPVHQGLLQGDAREERSVRISGGDHGL